MALKLPSFTLSRRVKILLGVLIVISTTACAIFLIWFSFRGLFAGNPAFLLKHVVVESSGWWKGKDTYVSAITNLRKGSVNLFSVDLAQLRKKLESEAGIKHLTVSRRLPDTIVFTITERIPRAFLGRLGSSLVIDEEGVVMQKEKCLNLDNNLPVIFGYRDRIPGVGQSFHRLDSSLELIMLTVRSFPDIRIASINAHNTDYLFFSMYYKNNFAEVFRVYIPTRNMHKNMTALISAMPSVTGSGEAKRTIDLRYEGKVTLKE